MISEAIALAKMLPIYPRSQNVAYSTSSSIKTRAPNMTKLTKFTQKYFTHEVSMARDVRCDVSRAMRMSLAEQAFLTTLWLCSLEAWCVVLTSHRRKVNCITNEVMKRVFVLLL